MVFAYIKKLLQIGLILAVTPLEEAKRLTFDGAYEESAAILKDVKPERDTESLYHFLAAVNAFKTNNKKEASKHLEYIEDMFNEIPRRYSNLAFLMREELKFWEEGDIGDISRDQDHIAKRLEHLKGGPKTQKLQEEALRKLNKLIKDKEDEANAQAQAQAEKNKPQDAKGRRDAAGNPISPQDDSVPGSESGPGNIDPKKFKEITQQWGKLPEKERIRAMQEIIRDMPPRYKHLIQEYFNKLSETSK